MNLGILTNISSIRASNEMTKRARETSKTNNRIASGKRVNSASDDAARLSISSKMKAQIKSLEMADKNSQDAKSLIRTAEGGLNEISSMLNRVRELTVQSANDTNNFSDRIKIAGEVAQLLTGIDDVAKNINFNEKKLLNGDFETKTLQFQLGSNDGQTLEVNINSMFVDDMMLEQIKDVFGAVNGKKEARQYSVTYDPTNQVILFPGTPNIHKAGNVEVDQNYIKNNSTQLEIKIKFRDAVDDEHTETLNVTIPKSANVTDFNRALSKAITENSKYFTADYQNTGGFDLKPSPNALGTTALSFDVTGPSDAKVKYTGEREVSKIGNHLGDVNHYDLRNARDGLKIMLSSSADPNAPKYVYTYRTNGNADPHKGEFGTIEQLKEAAFLDGNTIVGSSLRRIIPIVGRKEKEFTTKYGNVSDNGAKIASALEGLDKSLDNITSLRAQLGAIENSLEVKSNNLKTSFLNLTNANSVLEDADISKEFIENTKNNILVSSTTTILAQANQEPKNVLSLLQ